MTIVQTGKTMKNTVLVIDDEPLIRDIATMMLENVGYDVLVAEDGVAGAEMAAKHRQEILLVLCDLRMPGIDGWQTIVALQEVAPELPVALMSGQAIDKATCDQHPVKPWATIQKPYALEALNDLLQRAKNALPPAGAR
jgi:two-component system cell cycle sensor histidine kinase/response regulator CckA